MVILEQIDKSEEDIMKSRVLEAETKIIAEPPELCTDWTRSSKEQDEKLLRIAKELGLIGRKKEHSPVYWINIILRCE